MFPSPFNHLICGRDSRRRFVVVNPSQRHVPTCNLESEAYSVSRVDSPHLIILYCFTLTFGILLSGLAFMDPFLSC